MLDILFPRSPTGMDRQNGDMTAATRQIAPTVRARIELPNVTVEVLSYKWDSFEAVVAGTASYQVFRLLTPMRHKRRLRWRLEGELYPRSVAQVSVVPPYSPIILESGAGQAAFVSCGFAPADFERAIGISGWSDALTAAFLSLHNPFIEAIMDRIAQEIAVPQDNSAPLLDAAMSSLTFELARVVRHSQKPLGTGRLAHWRLARVRALVENSVDGATMAVAELAQLCSISPRHLMRGFKAATGTTIHAFVAQIRIERAKALLEASSLPLRDISDQVGFSNPSHFAAEFRRRIGCSPSEHRARARTT
jgi:AraC-like DNA-binding protein